MYLREIFLFLLLTYCGNAQNNGDLESIIKQIFGEPNNINGNQNNFGTGGQNTGSGGQNTGSSGQNTGTGAQNAGRITTNPPIFSITEPPVNLNPVTNSPTEPIRRWFQDPYETNWIIEADKQNTGSGEQNTGSGGQNTGSGAQNAGRTTNPPISSTTEPHIDLNPVTNSPTNNNNIRCLTNTNEIGECVHYYLCGTNLIDVGVRDGPCKSYLDICCLLADIRQPDNPITPTPKKIEENRQGCGWRNPNGIGFRIKGNENNKANFGEFPWMVAILKVVPVNKDRPDLKWNVYAGGGSLIHPSVVLTVAHYVVNEKNLRVRAGEWDTQTKKEIYPYQDRNVKEVISHKNFNSRYLFYDVAILILDKPMELAPNVGVACLPPPDRRLRAGTRCFVSGWGKDKFGKRGRYQVILKRFELPVVDRRQCQTRLRKTHPGAFFKLHTSFMCAGGENGQDTCKGDGGSPLVCPIEFEEDRYEQNGIVAWGIECGEDYTPGVYVDVSKVRNWIDDQVAGKGFDPKTYSY